MPSNENKNNCHCMTLEILLQIFCVFCVDSQKQRKKMLMSSEKLILKIGFLKMKICLLFKTQTIFIGWLCYFHCGVLMYVRVHHINQVYCWTQGKAWHKSLLGRTWYTLTFFLNSIYYSIRKNQMDIRGRAHIT